MKPDHKHGVIRDDKRNGLTDAPPPPLGHAFTLDEDTADLVGPPRHLDDLPPEVQLLGCLVAFLACAAVVLWGHVIVVTVHALLDRPMAGDLTAMPAIWGVLSVTVTGRFFLTRWAHRQLEASIRDATRHNEPR